MCSCARTCSGDRVSVGASRSSPVETRTAASATGSPEPDRTSAKVDSEPSSTADAWAPLSSDSAVVSGDVRRSPLSRSTTSMPSRAAANADGTPSNDSNQARGSSEWLTSGTLSSRYFGK